MLRNYRLYLGLILLAALLGLLKPIGSFKPQFHVIPLAKADLFGHWNRFIDLATDNWNSGTQTQAIGTSDDTLRAALYQPDGKLVAVGRSFEGTNNRLLVVRFHPDGSLDSTFDNDGLVFLTGPGGGESLGHALARDAAGRILVAGRQWGYADFDFAVMRLNSDGSVDTNFASDGYQRVNFGGHDFARSVKVDSNGRIILVGYSNQGGTYDFAAARLDSTGSLDGSFDSDGMLTTSIGTAWDIAYAADLESNNKIVAVGRADISGNPRIAIVRYNVNGTLDSSFSSDGVDTWAIGATDDVAWSVAIGAQNAPLVAGRSRSGSQYRFALAVYDSAGTQSGSQVYTIDSGGTARAIAVAGNQHYFGGRAYDGSDWNFAAIRVDSLAAGFGFDSGFGSGGITTTGVGSNDDAGYGMAVQNDDRVFVVGGVYGSNFNFGIVRFRTDGTLDSTFSSDGLASTAIGTGQDIAYAVAIQNDQKPVVGGTRESGSNRDFALIRYLTDGTIDSTFSTDGIQATSIGSGSSIIHAVAVETSGRIVVAGSAYNGSNGDFALARYLANGTIDSAFSSDGLLLTDFNTADDSAYSLKIDANGRYVVAGYAGLGNTRRFSVARYRTDGTMDSSFASDGLQTLSFSTASDDIAFGVAIQTDGKLVLAGHAHNGARTDVALARLNSDGTIDSSFSSDGLLTTTADTSTGSQVHAITMLANGKIFVGGKIRTTENQILLLRYNTNGVLDTSFDSDGIIMRSISTGDDAIYAVDTDSQGRLLAAGQSYSSNFDFLAIRLIDSIGGGFVLDNTFDSDGRVTTAISTGNDSAFAMAYDNGKLALVGRVSNGSNYDIALARYNENGSLAASGDLDLNFGSNGSATTDFSSGADFALGVSIQADGKAVVVGRSHDGTDDNFAVARYNQDGTLDTNFSSDGRLTTAITTGDDAIHGVDLTSDQKIVAAGFAENGSVREFAIARYRTNGTLDSTFSSDGIVTTAFTTSSDDFAYAVVVQNDDKIVAGGHSHNNNTVGFAIARYLTTGVLDSTFSSDGLVVTEIDTTTENQLHALALQNDGKIVAAGRIAGRENEFALIRYNSDGSLDSTFDTDGTVRTSVTGGNDAAYAIKIANDGKIVLAGQAFGSRYDFGVARYHSDGRLDSTFSSDGLATSAISTNDDTAYAVGIQDNGKVVIAGYSYASEYNFGLTRLHTGGAADASFGSTGNVTTDLNGDDIATGIAFTSDGRIVVVGYSEVGGQYDFAIVRYWP